MVVHTPDTGLRRGPPTEQREQELSRHWVTVDAVAPGILYAFSFLLLLMTQEDRYSYLSPVYREGNQDAQLVRTQTQAFFSKTQALS